MDVPPTPADLLPKPTYYQLIHTLRTHFPPPATDHAEDAARRDQAAIAHAASLLPANPEEAHLAAQYVAAGAQALECLRLARIYADDPAVTLKCTAQSASMSRQALRWRAALERAQAERRQHEADPPAAPADPPAPDPITEAERYALHHRKRAVLIRRLGRLPDKVSVGALTPEVVRAIATGTTPILRALDDKRPRVMAVAA